MSRIICARCRHPRPLHSQGAHSDSTQCQARGCHAGPGGMPCQQFVPLTDVAASAVVPAAVFHSPQLARTA